MKERVQFVMTPASGQAVANFASLGYYVALRASGFEVAEATLHMALSASVDTLTDDKLNAVELQQAFDSLGSLPDKPGMGKITTNRHGRTRA